MNVVITTSRGWGTPGPSPRPPAPRTAPGSVGLALVQIDRTGSLTVDGWFPRSGPVLWPPTVKAGCGHGRRLPPPPPAGQLGLLLIECLVADSARRGSEAVSAGHSLVVHKDEGTCSRHQGKDGHRDEDEVAGSQAWLRPWALTCRE